jgi:hypothetical protein
LGLLQANLRVALDRAVARWRSASRASSQIVVQKGDSSFHAAAPDRDEVCGPVKRNRGRDSETSCGGSYNSVLVVKYLLFCLVLLGVLTSVERLVLTDGAGHNSLTGPETPCFVSKLSM